MCQMGVSKIRGSDLYPKQKQEGSRRKDSHKKDPQLTDTAKCSFLYVLGDARPGKTGRPGELGPGPQ